MKAMLFGFIAIVVISLGANAVLGALAFSSSQRYVSPAVRN